MKDYFIKYRSGEEWLIAERKWDKLLQNSIESQFALGNGFIGSRGVLEEIPAGAKPGTYIAGLYDKTGAQVTELVNLPNPINVKIVAGGERLGVDTMDVMKHDRVLNMRYGLLMRRTLYRNSHKKRFDYQSIRFVSMRNKHIVCARIYITPLDENAVVTIQNLLDLSVTNGGILTEGHKKHFKIEEVSSSDVGEYISVRTLEKDILVAYGRALMLEKNGSSHFAKDVATQVRLKKDQTLCLTGITSIFSDDGKTPLKTKAVVKSFLKKSINIGFDGILGEHMASWDKLWAASDIRIRGLAGTERALHFNTYHLIICGREGNGESSIGAKTLSGEGYRGHVFWDSEIFMLPFFIYNRPKAAKNMLIYRYNRINRAKKIAESMGYKGAMFPWESADTGEETTPPWAKNYDGSLIQIRTHELEHHITADIAYGVYNYYTVTRDDAFMVKYGFEILFETARFWASRVEFNAKTKNYDIRHVIGPDEFHEDVDNNAYTNYMARFNLLKAYEAYHKMKKDYPAVFKRLSKKLNLKEKEARIWKKIASKVTFRVKKNGLIEQFDGFFRKKKVELKNLSERPLPPIPKSVRLIEIGKTQLVKQADVVMLLYLFWDDFDAKIKKKNFYYYLKKTLHKSSLSTAIHSITASRLGNIKSAARYFDIALKMDIDLTYGNTEDGIHAASLGGVWQAVVHGFLGIKVSDETLFIDPRLPEGWKEVSFSLKWQGYNVRLSVSEKRVEAGFHGTRKKDRLKAEIFGIQHKIEANKVYRFLRQERGDFYAKKQKIS